MFTDTQREERFKQATKIQCELYDGYEAGLALGEITKKHLITKYSQFSIAIGDVILGLVPQEKLPDLLIERLHITRPEAMKVTADVLDFLAPLSGGVATRVTPTPPAPTTTKTIPDTEILEVELAQTEASLPAAVVQPMRTMAHDMETARQPEGEPPTHKAASQADLLTGNQTQNPDATWNTTQS